MNNLELKWGTASPILYKDSEYGEIELIIRGICNYSVNDMSLNMDSLNENIQNVITSCVAKIVNECQNDSYLNIKQLLNERLYKMLLAEPIQNVVINSIQIHGVNLSDLSQRKVDAAAENKVKIVKTDIDSKDGQDKCPKCGSTEISTNTNNGLLRCNFCRYEFAPEKVSGMVDDLSQLKGQVIGSGATDIIADTNDVITLKCNSCGSEVVIDTASSNQARCHWCRNTLSINQQIPNGSVPDVVLPFGINKDTAKMEIEKFVGKRKFFAHPKFKQEFNVNNIMGVYFPYMLVDVNAHTSLIGQGEHQTRKYYRGSGNNQTAYYDADLYHVEREFDLIINGLSVESSSDKLNTSSREKTTNIINAIMPFDVENCVKYNSNYLKGYTSERRDTNVEQLRNLVDVQSKDIARFAANETLKQYDRGVVWSTEQLDIKGQQWKAAYLPVWLYSYQQIDGGKKILHYVAVNARTKETMGSVPIHMPKLFGISALVEILGILLTVFVDWDYRWIFLLAGIVYFFIMYTKYRNSNARHTYETQTKKQMSNLRKVDNFIQSKKGLTNSTMEGANNKVVNGQNSSSKVFNSMSGQNVGNQIANSVIDNNAIASFIRDNIDNKGGK